MQMGRAEPGGKCPTVNKALGWADGTNEHSKRMARIQALPEVSDSTSQVLEEYLLRGILNALQPVSFSHSL